MVRDTGYYDWLGLKPDCSREQIRKAYLTMALKYHPDKNPEGRDMFQKVNQAYEVLFEPQSREQYDRFGTEGAEEVHFRSAADVFSAAFGRFGDRFRQDFSSGVRFHHNDDDNDDDQYSDDDDDDYYYEEEFLGFSDMFGRHTCSCCQNHFSAVAKREQAVRKKREEMKQKLKQIKIKLVNGTLSERLVCMVTIQGWMDREATIDFGKDALKDVIESIMREGNNGGKVDIDVLLGSAKVVYSAAKQGCVSELLNAGVEDMLMRHVVSANNYIVLQYIIGSMYYVAESSSVRKKWADVKILNSLITLIKTGHQNKNDSNPSVIEAQHYATKVIGRICTEKTGRTAVLSSGALSALFELPCRPNSDIRTAAYDALGQLFSALDSSTHCSELGVSLKEIMKPLQTMLDSNDVNARFQAMVVLEALCVKIIPVHEPLSAIINSGISMIAVDVMKDRSVRTISILSSVIKHWVQSVRASDDKEKTVLSSAVISRLLKLAVDVIDHDIKGELSLKEEFPALASIIIGHLFSLVWWQCRDDPFVNQRIFSKIEKLEIFCEDNFVNSLFTIFKKLSLTGTIMVKYRYLPLISVTMIIGTLSLDLTLGAKFLKLGILDCLVQCVQLFENFQKERPVPPINIGTSIPTPLRREDLLETLGIALSRLIIISSQRSSSLKSIIWLLTWGLQPDCTFVTQGCSAAAIASVASFSHDMAWECVRCDAPKRLLHLMITYLKGSVLQSSVSICSDRMTVMHIANALHSLSKHAVHDLVSAGVIPLLTDLILHAPLDRVVTEISDDIRNGAGLTEEFSVALCSQMVCSILGQIASMRHAPFTELVKPQVIDSTVRILETALIPLSKLKDTTTNNHDDTCVINWIVLRSAIDTLASLSRCLLWVDDDTTDMDVSLADHIAGGISTSTSSPALNSSNDASNNKKKSNNSSSKDKPLPVTVDTPSRLGKIARSLFMTPRVTDALFQMMTGSTWRDSKFMAAVVVIYGNLVEAESLGLKTTLGDKFFLSIPLIMTRSTNVPTLSFVATVVDNLGSALPDLLLSSDASVSLAAARGVRQLSVAAGSNEILHELGPAVPALCSVLASPNTRALSEAARAISHLCGASGNVALILENPLFCDTVAELLRLSDQMILRYALLAIKEITIIDPGFKLNLKKLLTLLSCKDAMSVTAVIDILCHISTTDHKRVQIVQAGLLIPIVKLLKGKNSDLVCRVVLLLQHLGEYHPNCIKLEEMGVLSSLRKIETEARRDKDVFLVATCASAIHVISAASVVAVATVINKMEGNLQNETTKTSLTVRFNDARDRSESPSSRSMGDYESSETHTMDGGSELTEAEREKRREKERLRRQRRQERRREEENAKKAAEEAVISERAERRLQEEDRRRRIAEEKERQHVQAEAAFRALQFERLTMMANVVFLLCVKGISMSRSEIAVRSVIPRDIATGDPTDSGAGVGFGGTAVDWEESTVLFRATEWILNSQATDDERNILCMSSKQSTITKNEVTPIVTISYMVADSSPMIMNNNHGIYNKMSSTTATVVPIGSDSPHTTRPTSMSTNMNVTDDFQVALASSAPSVSPPVRPPFTNMSSSHPLPPKTSHVSNNISPHRPNHVNMTGSLFETGLDINVYNAPGSSTVPLYHGIGIPDLALPNSMVYGVESLNSINTVDTMNPSTYNNHAGPHSYYRQQQPQPTVSNSSSHGYPYGLDSGYGPGDHHTVLYSNNPEPRSISAPVTSVFSGSGLSSYPGFGGMWGGMTATPSSLSDDNLLNDLEIHNELQSSSELDQLAAMLIGSDSSINSHNNSSSINGSNEMGSSGKLGTKTSTTPPFNSSLTQVQFSGRLW